MVRQCLNRSAIETLRFTWEFEDVTEIVILHPYSYFTSDILLWDILFDNFIYYVKFVMFIYYVKFVIFIYSVKFVMFLLC